MDNSQIKEKIGQMFMLDFRFWKEEDIELPVRASNKYIKSIIADRNIGGVILFKDNFVDIEQSIKLIRSLQSSAKKPLLIGVDQEGGRVNRLPFGTSTCGNMATAATNNPHNARLNAQIISAELKSLGINLNFAPVVDINSNPKNPIIGVRAYSDNAETVVKYAREAIKAYKDNNIINCIKHFPGHGDTSEDTHSGIVEITKDCKSIYDTELYPYKKLIDENLVDSVMTAHISMPAIYNEKHNGFSIPASLSKKVITGVLRKELGFDGLVITDAMDMGAISTYFDEITAIKMTILAGTDILLMPVRIWSKEDITKLDNLIDELVIEYNHNKEFADRIDISNTRISHIKSKQKLDESVLYSLTQDQQIQKAKDIINSKSHREIEADIANNAITKKLTNNLIPFEIKQDTKILIIDSDNQRANDFIDEIDNLNIDIKYSCKYLSIDDNDVFDDIKNADLVLIISDSLKSYSKKYSKITNAATNKSINIAALTPYDINYIDNIENYICIYGATSMDQTNYKKTSLKTNIKAGVMSIFKDINSGCAFNEKQGIFPVKL